IVEPEFKETVLKREEMSPTSFVNAFAIPHAFGAFAKNSTIAVAQLKNPLKWGGFEVRLVMLFAINEGDRRMIKIFFDWVSNVVNQPQELAKICASCTYEEFIDRITG
ncbi:MAG: PTS sugar transporter subunit IIA, partial [Clostridium sp.]|nr:PTS sugar transporter subunit IIA [Clostridium sp.]